MGRVQAALTAAPSSWAGRLRTRLVAMLATSFPADGSAELNLVPVDRVAAGVLAALTAPGAIGARIHLATDRRIRARDMGSLHAHFVPFTENESSSHSMPSSAT